MKITWLSSSSFHLGLSIAGGKGAAANRIFVVDVKPGGPAEKNGQIEQADEILEVNEVTIRGLTHYEASTILKVSCATELVTVFLHFDASYMRLLLISEHSAASWTDFRPNTRSGRFPESIQDTASSGIPERTSVSRTGIQGTQCPDYWGSASGAARRDRKSSEVCTQSEPQSPSCLWGNHCFANTFERIIRGTESRVHWLR